MDLKNSDILITNSVYFMVAILLIFIGSMVQGIDLLVGLLITEYILVLLPVILYYLITQKPIKVNLRLNRIDFKNAMLAMIITVFLYPALIFINFSILTILGQFKELEEMSLPAPQSFTEFLGFLFVAAISAGICEELFFRGFLMSNYKKLGKEKAILISAFLFAIFHFNIQNFIGPLILGIVFGGMVYKTGSIFAGIIGHITNNSVALTLSWVMSRLYNSGANVAAEELVEPKPQEMVLSIIMFGVLALICVKIVSKLYEKISQVDLYEKDFYAEDQYEILVPQRDLKKWVWLPVVMVVSMYLFLVYVQLTY